MRPPCWAVAARDARSFGDSRGRKEFGTRSRGLNIEPAMELENSNAGTASRQ